MDRPSNVVIICRLVVRIWLTCLYLTRWHYDLLLEPRAMRRNIQHRATDTAAHFYG